MGLILSILLLIGYSLLLVRILLDVLLQLFYLIGDAQNAIVGVKLFLLLIFGVIVVSLEALLDKFYCFKKVLEFMLMIFPSLNINT